MDYKNLLDNDSSEKLLKKAKDNKDLPKKIIESEGVHNMLNNGIDELNARTEGATTAIKKVISQGIDGKESTNDSLTLGYLSLLYIPPLILTIIASIFAFLIMWLLLFALCIILVIYLVISKFKEKLQNSSASLIISIIASICEGVIISLLADSIDATVFAAEIALLMAAFAVTSLYAKTLGQDYTKNSGRRISLIVFACMGILFIIFLTSDFIVLVFFI